MSQAFSDWRGRGEGVGAVPLAIVRTGLILLALLLLVLVRDSQGSVFDRALPFVDALLVVWCLVHLGALARQFRGGGRWWTPATQVSVDLFVALALIWCTGGVNSFFVPLLLASMLCASTVFAVGPALIIASAATLTLTTMTVADEVGWSPAQSLGVELATGPAVTRFSSLVGQGIALHGIAYLGARLTGRLRRVVGINDRIVANIGEGIVALDGRGRLLLLNEEALRILDYPADVDWRGRSPAELFRRTEDRPFLEALSEPQQGEREVTWRLGRRERLPLSIRMTRLPGTGNVGGGWVAVLRDLTLQKRAAAADARVQQLEQLEDVALGLAHEVRNPLASIRGCVQELGRGNLAPDQVERLSAIVMRESDRLDRIVDEFLRYARTAPTTREPVDLGACLREVVETLAGRPDARGVELTLDEGDAAEARCGKAIVMGEKELLYRVFLNLGINALEALGGKGHLRLALAPGRPEGCLVEVEDDGPGMSEAVRRRIFHPFFSTKPREGGLGLALAERVVHGHGGLIEVESEQGGGTRFRVFLPEAAAAVVPGTMAEPVENLT